jgi:hypothetical protein
MYTNMHVTEVEFLDINLTEDSSLLRHAFHSPFYWRIWKKAILFLNLQSFQKKPRNKKTLVYYSRIAFCIMEKSERKVESQVENQTKTQVWEDSGLCPETSTKNVVQEFHLCAPSIYLIIIEMASQGRWENMNLHYGSHWKKAGKESSPPLSRQIPRRAGVVHL